MQHLCVAQIWHSSTQAILLYSISSDKSRTVTNLTATQSFLDLSFEQS